MEREKLIPKEAVISGAIWSTVSIGAIVALLFTSTRPEQDGSYTDESYPYQVKNERIVDSLVHGQSVFARDLIVPLPLPTQEKEVDRITSVTKVDPQVTRSEVVSGPATFYGVIDGYGPEDPLGCTGESFDPYDPTIAARPKSSPFECGDKVRVCDKNSCIDVEIKDTCPGCDDFGIVVDLSYGAMNALSPGSGKVTVTLEELK